MFIISFLFSLTACKTQEDIRREKTVENLNEQVAQTQKSTASAGARFNSIEEQLAKLTGQIEESGHSKQQENKEISQLKERLENLEETNKKQTEFMKALNEKIQDQSTYIEQVIKSLSALTEQQKEQKEQQKELQAKKKEKSEGSQLAPIKAAVAKYKSKDLNDAKSLFHDVLEDKKTKKKDKETAVYYLGQIEYKNKNYEESKVYFSKLISENPDSSYAPSAFLILAKTFLQLKSKEEAAQSLDELITRFPKSKEAQEGAKLKSKI
jgi:TolA-binding protein